jgi:hypothetical protein
VARQPHVVGQILRAVSAADAAVLTHDLPFFSGVQPLEGADAA